MSEKETLVAMFYRIDGYFSRDIRPHGLCDDFRAALAEADARLEAGAVGLPWQIGATKELTCDDFDKNPFELVGYGDELVAIAAWDSAGWYDGVGHLKDVKYHVPLDAIFATLPAAAATKGADDVKGADGV